MSEENQKKLFGISAIICIILLTITYFGDLAISNTLINYHSWVGTFCQTFGEFPVYLIFALCGQITMTYAWKGDCEKLLGQDRCLLAGLHCRFGRARSMSMNSWAICIRYKLTLKTVRR